MRFKFSIRQWQGVFLCLVSCTAVVWLGATKQLDLYIHPRYITFTIILATIALVGAVGSIVYRTQDFVAAKSKWPKLNSAGTIALCIATVIGLLVAKPTTLTSVTAAQRGIGETAPANNAIPTTTPLFSQGNYTSFTVKDWSSLLAQTQDISVYASKTAQIVGFITPDPDAQDVFFVSRFLITCCAVDAQPIGVPVYLPHWQSQYKPGQWVAVKGGFTAQKEADASPRIVMQPADVTHVSQPKEPYVY